jgi:hypothetical protein
MTHNTFLRFFCTAVIIKTMYTLIVFLWFTAHDETWIGNKGTSENTAFSHWDVKQHSCTKTCNTFAYDRRIHTCGGHGICGQGIVCRVYLCWDPVVLRIPTVLQESTLNLFWILFFVRTTLFVFCYSRLVVPREVIVQIKKVCFILSLGESKITGNC